MNGGIIIKHNRVFLSSTNNINFRAKSTRAQVGNLPSLVVVRRIYCRVNIMKLIAIHNPVWCIHPRDTGHQHVGSSGYNGDGHKSQEGSRKSWWCDEAEHTPEMKTRWVRQLFGKERIIVFCDGQRRKTLYREWESKDTMTSTLTIFFFSILPLKLLSIFDWNDGWETHFNNEKT